MGLFNKNSGKTVPAQPVERYLKLDEEDFKCLVRGGTLHVDNLRIILSDIGFDRMDAAITLADNGVNLYKDRVKEASL